MSIDWFTLIAEIVNFLILLWLLQRFLYQPIVNAMEAREQNIANRLQEAEEKNEQAQAEAEQYRAMQEDLQAQRDEMLEQARHEAETRRKDLIAQARDEMEDMRNNWQLAIQQEKASFLNEVEQRIGESVIVLTRRMLSDIAGEELETRIVNKFIQRLRGAEDTLRERIAQAFRDQTVEVDSAFELPKAKREAIQNALRDVTHTQVTLKYHVKPHMLYGIRLSTGDYEISWDIGEYTDALRDQFTRIIDNQMNERAVGEYG